MAGATEVRSFDGSGNNVVNDNWGAANTQLLRLTTVEYGPGPAANDQYGNIVFPAMAVRVDSNGDTINPRTVSNLIFNQDESVLNDRGLTSFVFQWGQFLDHDMDLTEDFVPVGQMDPNGVIDPGSESISFSCRPMEPKASCLLGRSFLSCDRDFSWTMRELPSRSIRSRHTLMPRTCTVRTPSERTI
ncbi:MAG: peroxidase family protein [Planctomycetaceae bacterium]